MSPSPPSRPSRPPMPVVAVAPPPADAATRSGGDLSALREALATVGDRWSGLVVAALLDGPLRFGELQERLDGIAPNVLTQRLRALEQESIVLARPYSERPPRFLYELTEAGRELASALRMLTDWGARHTGGRGAEPAATSLRHGACDTPLQARWYCPTCEQVVDPPQAGGDEDDEVFYG